MITVETCLKKLEGICLRPVADPSGQIFEITNVWDRRFLGDVAEHSRNGKAISTAQSAVVLKLIDRYRDHLLCCGLTAGELDQLLAFPRYAIPPYQSTLLPREVRWAGDNKLVFRCKYNAGIIEDIKKLKGENHFLPQFFPTFSKEKLWLVDVNSENYQKVMDVIKRHRFSFDDTVAEFFMNIENSRGQRSDVIVDGDTISVVVKNDSLLNGWLNAIKNLES
jgi:hypothetical protein